MKKPQLKVPANKNRLQINRAKHDAFQGCELRGSHLGENLSNYGKIQSKEEKGLRKDRLPSVHLPPAFLQAELTEIKENQLQTRKKISFSLSAGKPKEPRRSASIDSSKNSEKGENEQQGLSEAIKELIRAFQNQKLRKNNGHTMGPSSTDIQSALRYIITNKNITEKPNRSLSKNRLSLGISQESVFAKARKSSFAVDLRDKGKKKLKISSRNVHIAIDGAASGQRKMAELREEANRLGVEKNRMEKVVQILKDRIQEQKKVIQEFQVQKQSLSAEILKESAQLQEMRRFIQNNRDILAKMEAKRFQIQTFVAAQPNKIVKQASEYHKNLEIDLFQFADYLRHHPLGKKQYQPSIYYDQIQRTVNIELQEMVKCLNLQKKQRQHKKCEEILKFLEKLRHQQKLMNNQLQQVIEQKTKYIEKYSSIMFFWYENYLTKKEYLSNLKDGFSLEVVKIQEASRKVKHMEKSGNCPNCAETKAQVQKLMESVQKVVELFSLGNSFY